MGFDCNQELRILVIDDMKIMLKIMTHILTSIGFKNIQTAYDGANAWELIEKAVKDDVPFELIISDWNMPFMSGFKLLEKIRSSDATKDTPFIMITAEVEKASIEKAIHAGADNYIGKPFSKQTVEAKISQALQGKNK